jgi:hypothetical protein
VSQEERAERPAQAVAARWMARFEDVSPRRKPASFSLEEVMTKKTTAHNGQN